MITDDKMTSRYRSSVDEWIGDNAPNVIRSCEKQ